MLQERDGARGESLVLIGVFIAVILVISVVMGLFTTIPAGNVGIADTFGVVDDNVFQPGLHLKLPWTTVTMMSGQTQKYLDYGNSDTATITALSNEGFL